MRLIEVEGFDQRRVIESCSREDAVRIIRWCLRVDPPTCVSELIRFRENRGRWTYLDPRAVLPRGKVQVPKG